jgi:Starch-binding associating with outer membrane
MNYSKILILGFAATLSFGSCKKFLDHTVDPNSPTVEVATADLVLPAALRNTGAIYNNPTSGNNTFAFAGIWMGHMSYSGNFAVNKENVTYNITGNYGAGLWTLCYDNNADYDFVEKAGEKSNNKFYQGVGKLMKAYNYQTLVDVYNKVPYSEALKGANVPSPKYDDGQVIYESLLKDIDAAIVLLNAAGTAVTKGDIMFGGDAAKWIDFANTVRLRMLVRQSSNTARAAYIAANKGGQGSSYLSSDVEIDPLFQNTAGKQNPLWENSYNLQGSYNEDFFRAGGYAINFFKNVNDPRIGRIYDKVGTDYVGNLLGDQGLVNSKTSQFGPGILKSFDQPMILMTAAESYFLQAEAALDNIISGDAKALYEQGVLSSFETMGLTAADLATYFTQSSKSVNWASCTSDAERRALIIRQKWAATCMINELEPWNDFRRTGEPSDMHISTDVGSTGKIPNRLLYPIRELTVNGASVNAAGAVTPNSKIWWQQ